MQNTLAVSLHQTSAGQTTSSAYVANLNIGSTTTKQNAYNSLVRPIVEYASTVWDPYTQKDIHTLEMVPCIGARYICNKHGNRSSVDTMLDKLKWKTL